MLSWGAATIEVTTAGLAAGRLRLPVSQLGEATALDADQSRAIRGPRADPAAYLLIRPYLPRSVYVEIKDQPAGQPYLLLGTRSPAQLAEAIERARRGACATAAWNDAGSAATLQGKDGHAQ